VVRRIFEEYAKGERAKNIYIRLNAEGYRTSRGTLFNKSSLRRILQNEKYIGVYEYEDIRVENGIPAIIDRKLFEEVQVMIKKNHDSPGKGYKHSFLLTAKLFCGMCGGTNLAGDSGTSQTGQVYAYYTCNKRKYEHTCKKERVSKDWIEKVVVEKMYELLNSDGFIDTVADKVMEFQKREQDRSALNALEARQKDNEKAIANMLAAIEAGIVTPSTKSRLMELEAQRNDIDKSIARELISEPYIDREQIITFLALLKNGDTEDEKYRILLIDTLLNSVFLYDDKLVLSMNYDDKGSKITFAIMEKAVMDGGAECSSLAPSSASCFNEIRAYRVRCSIRFDLISSALKLQVQRGRNTCRCRTLYFPEESGVLFVCDGNVVQEPLFEEPWQFKIHCVILFGSFKVPPNFGHKRRMFLFVFF